MLRKRSHNTTNKSEHPNIPIYTGVIDRCLDDKAYIRPGVGDAGDRIYGTQ